ncbi:DUF2442 domain-containing protein [Tistrella mobilis]|uniref:DUF2442 domain-containing protein n=1 Tax=Tistrella mobilis TaxID=171437 RepID=UPI0035593603
MFFLVTGHWNHMMISLIKRLVGFSPQEHRQAGYAVAARYDRRTGRVVVKLNTEVQISFPPRLAEGLAGAAPEDLAVIEISPSGLGLHWPRLDADLYVPGLMAGQLGSKRWMTAQFGAAGGRVRRAPRR